MSSPSPIPLQYHPWLLDRRRAAHPWLDSLARLERGKEAGAPALAANWRMDPRVDDDRERQLRDSGCFSGDNFDKAVRDYFSLHQCRPAQGVPAPGYVDAANACNLIATGRRPASNHRLLHLLSVNSVLKWLLRRGAYPGQADFLMALEELLENRLPPYGNPGQINRFTDTLAGRLLALGTDSIKRFAGVVSEALGDNEPLWWAAFAHEVDGLLQSDDWSDAARCLGMGHLSSGDWLMAWRYSPDLAGPLYRPSVAEARDNGFHFPSPPLETYGIAMPLRPGLSAVRELVHPPLKGDTSAASCTGRLGRIAQPLAVVEGTPAFNRWLKHRRQEHRGDLATNDGARAWLQRHR